MGSLLRDVRLAFRLLGRRPSLAALTVLSLGLAIGANTTVFSIINSILLRPLPVQDPDRLVAAYTSGSGGGLFGGSSFAELLAYRDLDGVFTDALGYVWAPLTLSRDRGAERIWAQVVTPNYFSVLGVDAAVGRTLTSARDLAAPGEPEVVVSDGFWRRELNADPKAVGGTLKLNGKLFSIVGVAPEEFQGTELSRIPELWVSSAGGADLTLGAFSPDNPRLRVLSMVGRLKDGVSVESAQARLQVVAQQLAQAGPPGPPPGAPPGAPPGPPPGARPDGPGGGDGRHISLVPANRARVHPFVRESITSYFSLLMALVGVLLLVACGNLASLMLVQGLRRQSEVAIRMAIGASRPGLVRQFLVESVLLALLGGAAGLLFTLWSTRILSTISPPDPFPVAMSISPDLRVFVFTLLLTFGLGVLFGLAPALRATRPDLAVELKDQAPVGAGRRSRLLGAFVVLQVAFCVILLIAAGLFMRTLRKVEDIRLGFNPRNVLVASFQLGPMSGYTPEQGNQLYEKLLARVRSLPGVRAASFTSLVPMDFGGMRGAVFPEGISQDPDKPPLESDMSVVGPDFFSTMEIPLLHGRAFGPQDTESAPPMVIINEHLAKLLWGTSDVVGRRVFLFNTRGDSVEVAGVVDTSKSHTIREEPTPLVYIYYTQLSEPLMSLVVRTAGEPNALVGAVRNEVRALDPDLPAFNIRTLEDQLATAMFSERVAALLSTALAVLALIQALVGLYGVLAYSVSQRTREIGLRMALGAQPREIRRLVVGHAMRLTSTGILAGLVGSWLAARLIATFLFGVSAADPATYVGIALAVIVFGLLASYLPLRRAFRVNPLIALKDE